MNPKLLWLCCFSWLSPLLYFKFKIMMLYCSNSKVSGEDTNGTNNLKSIVPKSLMHHYYHYYHEVVHHDNEFKEVQLPALKQNEPPAPAQRPDVFMEDKKYEDLNAQEKSETNKCAEASNKHTDSLYRLGLEGLEGMFDHVEQSGAKVLKKLGGVMDHMVQSKDDMMKSLDGVMERVSESVLESKDRVIKGFDTVMDKMSESKSKMMEELDYVLDNLAHSKVIEDIRALPREIRESFVLSVRNKSYIAAGVMVALTTAVLIAGALYYAWCHQDTWNHSIVPIEELPHTSVNVLTHVGTKFADGSVSGKGITSCFVRNSSQVFRTKSE